jgi:cobalt/nickel transport protein
MPQIKKSQAKKKDGVRFFDGFTRVMLAIMFVFLIYIFISGKIMASNNMEGGGTDDKVNDLASAVSKTAHHPFVELPGDAELGAFSIANLFTGLIVGHHWEKLFGSSKPKKRADQDNNESGNGNGDKADDGKNEDGGEIKERTE